MLLYEEGVDGVACVLSRRVVQKIFEATSSFKTIYILRYKTRARVGLDTFLFERSDPGTRAWHGFAKACSGGP